jgi:hypothetical protein
VHAPITQKLVRIEKQYEASVGRIIDNAMTAEAITKRDGVNLGT